MAPPCTSRSYRGVALSQRKPLSPRVQEGRRFALVIGNSRYGSLPTIPGVAADTTTLAASLRKAGFVVSEVLDCTRHQLLTATTALLATAQGPAGGGAFFAASSHPYLNCTSAGVCHIV
jgi:hypothetical protein